MGVRNTLEDLNDHLFAQLERLGDEDMDAEELAREIERARAVGAVAQAVVSNANTVLAAARFRDERLCDEGPLPRMLGGGR